MSTIVIRQESNDAWPRTTIPKKTTQINFVPAPGNQMLPRTDGSLCGGAKMGRPSVSHGTLLVPYDQAPDQDCLADLTLYWTSTPGPPDQQSSAIQSLSEPELAEATNGEGSGVAQLDLQSG
jgi:hypothetical protein